MKNVKTCSILHPLKITPEMPPFGFGTVPCPYALVSCDAPTRAAMAFVITAYGT
jgi:hypothetical protein